MVVILLKTVFAVVIAIGLGQLISKLRLPGILGWLLTGMLLGPYALNFLNQDLLDNSNFQVILRVLECSMGLMIGTELVIEKLKKFGRQIVVTMFAQSFGAFLLVTLSFSVIFYIRGVPLYLAAIFGAIALATAPAPALSIIKEFKTAGPVTNMLIPVAALDNVVAIIVFFSMISLLSAGGSSGSMPMFMVLGLTVLMPLILGGVLGIFAGLLLKKERGKRETLIITTLSVVVCSIVGLGVDYLILPSPMINYMLMGMAFSAVFANMVSQERLGQIMGGFNPIMMLALIVVIINLGAPLDYRFILSAGVYTVIYIFARGLGKYGGAFLGGKITKMPKTVTKYLGLTLLPHSGVSLVFTCITAKTLMPFDPASAAILQGTIAAAAVINEIIAVMLGKKAFEWAGEL